MALLKNFNDGDFQKQVLESTTPVLVMFWAVWSPTYKSVKFALEALAEEMKGKLVIGMLDIDENQDMTAQYRVNSTPDCLLFKNGSYVARLTGTAPGTKFRNFLEKNL